jgi:UDP-N-acetylglucosamine--N-acetylmuramyl-(pentapeptide) pyrophosphoryl-undecaprenol N-acetylglucosamine transferase
MQPHKGTYRFILSGGGTGGHLFPAIAIANALQAAQPDCEILFVGAQGRMEMERVPKAGFKIEGLWISGIQRSLSIQNLLFPVKLMASLVKSLNILRSFRPHAVIGVGGYASGPVLLAAQWSRIPTFIQEQNAHAGVTNKGLAKGVMQAYVAYDGMEKYFPADKITCSGNPIRQDLFALESKKEEALAAFGLNPNQPVLLVVGGSLGARTINRALAAGLDQLAKAGIQLIWQTGKAFAPEAEAAVKNYAGMWTGAFIERMDLAFAAATSIVSRAGAGTLSELAVVGKAVILVPSPNVAEDHQTKNALALSSAAAAILVKDKEAATALVEQAIALLADGSLQQQLAKAIATFDKRHAAADIAADILKRIGKGSKS